MLGAADHEEPSHPGAAFAGVARGPLPTSGRISLEDALCWIAYGKLARAVLLERGVDSPNADLGDLVRPPLFSDLFICMALPWRRGIPMRVRRWLAAALRARRRRPHLTRKLNDAAEVIFELARRNETRVIARKPEGGPYELLIPYYFDEPMRLDWSSGGLRLSPINPRTTTVNGVTIPDPRTRADVRVDAGDLMKALSRDGVLDARVKREEPPVEVRRRGRQPGDGKFPDEPHIQRMHLLISGGAATSAKDAARQVVNDERLGWGMPGGPRGHSREATIDRLRRRYREIHPRQAPGKIA